MEKKTNKTFLPDSILQYDRIGLGGLGGGADIVNCIPLYVYLLSLGKHVTLISCHGRSMNFLIGGEKITAYSKWVDETAMRGTGDRVFEHILCDEIQRVIEPIGYAGYQKPRVAFVSRHAESEGVARAFDFIVREDNLDCILLIDGGGDALECNGHYTSGTSHKGDSLVIEALSETYKVPTFVGIVACGIDTPKNWKAVVNQIKRQDGHEGRFDLVGMPNSILKPALDIMRSSVKMSSKDDPRLSPSLTCTTFWCSLIKHYEKINTQAHWKPIIQVIPDYSMLRVFKASVLNDVKNTFIKPKPAPVYTGKGFKYDDYWERQQEEIDKLSQNFAAEFNDPKPKPKKSADDTQPMPVVKKKETVKDLDEKQIQKDLRTTPESTSDPVPPPATQKHYKRSFWSWIAHHVSKLNEE